MLTGIDHIIIGVNDLAQAGQAYTRLGLIPSGGGSHPDTGTANRIIVIGDTYLELIAVRERTEAQPSLLERLAKGEGYLNFAITSDDAVGDAQKMRERGIAVVGPNHGELCSADGRVRAWTRVDVERRDLAQHYPFLIQHDSVGEERRRRLAGWQTPPEHPLGVNAVLSAAIAVADLGEATTRFGRIYGLEPEPTFTGEPDGWDAMLTAFPLGTGGQSFELATPLPLASDLSATETELLPQPGALAWYLRSFGEWLCRITLGVRDLATSRRYLDAQGITYTYRAEPRASLWLHPQQTCGAAIVLHEHDPKRVLDAGGEPEE